MITFLVASIVLSITPGPDMALVMRNVLVGGRSAGLATIAGLGTGLCVHATAAAVGVSAIIAASAAAFTILKLVGAAYLVYLGISALLAARRLAAGGESPHPRPEAHADDGFDADGTLA